MAALPYADIVKISEEELTFLTGCSDIEEGIARLPENKLTIVTLGGDGCISWRKCRKSLKRHKFTKQQTNLPILELFCLLFWFSKPRPLSNLSKIVYNYQIMLAIIPYQSL
ncbi:PfkB family carbohydrate kinase [Cytobacillus firmus]|uniref:PfkB family carbohydrate kinase n=1 Tax=Cytobacillus firmus TaxID=1399 RepID=UPI00368603EA